MNFINKKYFKYLKSQKAILVVGACVILIIVFSISPRGKTLLNKAVNKDSVALTIQKQTVSDLIQNDTDGDGVADWEESLWGTDKNKKITFDGIDDFTYIEKKKKLLQNEESANENKLTETEKFAREFFTSYTAMKSSGEVDTNTINGFSNALGQKIINPNLIDYYTEADLKINPTDSAVSKQKYYEDIKNVFSKYENSGMGDELNIVNNRLISDSGNNTNQSSQLLTISTAYQNFARDIMKTSVPKSISLYHLQIVNSANNTGISISNMNKMTDDPIVGLSGLSQYQKYNDDFLKGLENLKTALTQ